MVDLYLLYENNTGQYEQVKLWANLSRTQGVLVQLIDDSWYPSQLPDNSANKTWKPYAYVLSPGRNYQEEIDKLATSETYFPAPVQFTLIRKYARKMKREREKDRRLNDSTQQKKEREC